MVDLERLAVLVDREKIRRGGLLEFARRAWHLVEPSQPFVENWHHEIICRLAEACIAGEPWAVQQVINIPPGTGKSLFFCVFLPAWVWTEWPGFRSIYASFDISISRRDARRTLAIIQSDWYRARWPNVVLKSSKSAETDFSNTEGGFRFATSVESVATGRHAHLRVFDDPIKPLDTQGSKSASASQLDKVIDWWRGTMSTRVLDPSCPRYLGIMQRLHERDLSGWLCSGENDPKDRPLVVSFPMHFDPDRAFKSPDPGVPGDPRIEAGELFWPGRFPPDAVERLQRALGDHADAQLEQNPNPLKGSTFRRSRFEYYDEDPRLLARQAVRVVLSVDCAFKGKADSDRVAIQVWAEMSSDRQYGPGQSVGIWYALLACYAERLGFLATLAKIKEFLAAWPISCVLVEDKANGTAIMEVLARSVPNIVPSEPGSMSKEDRANAVQPSYQGHNVWHPRAEYCPEIADYEAELLKFPRGRVDDQVDATTQVLRYFAGQGMSVLEVLAQLMGK